MKSRTREPKSSADIPSKSPVSASAIRGSPSSLHRRWRRGEISAANSGFALRASGPSATRVLEAVAGGSRAGRSGASRTTGCRRCRSTRAGAPAGSSEAAVEERQDRRRGCAPRPPRRQEVRVCGHRAPPPSGAGRRRTGTRGGWCRCRSSAVVRAAGPVAQAVGVGAQVGAALDHLAADRGTAAGPGRSSPRGRRPAGSSGDAAGACRRRRDGGWSTSRRSTPTRCRPCRSARSRSPGRCPPVTCGPAALAGAAPREVRPVPGVGHDPTVRPGLVPPRERRALEAAAGGVLPLGLGRQVGAGPRRRRRGRPRARRGRPGGPGRRLTELPGPSGLRPAGAGVQVHHWLRWRRSTGPARRREHQRPRLEVLRRCAGEVRRVERPLRDGHVARCRARSRRTARWSPAPRRSRTRLTRTRWTGASSG